MTLRRVFSARSFVSVGVLRRFLSSMPVSYRDRFDSAAVRAHVRIVESRREDPVHVEVWESYDDGGAGVCVVADDRPGLLSLIAAAFDFADLEVTCAHAYCREREDGRVEAVDFFWVRPIEGDVPLGAADDMRISRVSLVLSQLLTDEGNFDDIPYGRAGSRVQTNEPARVGFDADDDLHGSAVLAVETIERPDLLRTITRALFEERAQIQSSEVLTDAGRLSARFYIQEFEGVPVEMERRDALVRHVTARLAPR